MKISTRIITLAFSFLVLSTSAFAGSNPKNILGAGGVVLDLGGVGPLPADIADTVDIAGTVDTKVSAGVVVEIPNVVAEQADTSVAESSTQSFPVALVEAAAEAAEAGDAAFKFIVDAMRPQEPVQPLKGKRATVYLSEKVVVAKLEVNAERFNIDNARAHVAALYSEQRDSVLQGGLALDASFVSSFRLSFGTRAYIALMNTENTDVFATALGIEAAYNLPFEALPLEFAASFYYAPDILTFGTADRAVDAQIDFSFPLRAQSSLFAGIRLLQVDTQPEDREIDNRLHMGIRWDFL